MNKKFKVKVNNESYEVEVEEVNEGTQTVSKTESTKKITPKKPDTSSQTSSKAKPKPRKKKKPSVASGGGIVTSPMAGTIADVKVSEGDSVDAGELVLVLEAMKMENEVYASGAGTVKEVNVSSGQKVESGDVLMVIE